MTYFISMLSVLISPFKILILLISSFFFLYESVYGLSILFIFSKTWLLVLLIIAVITFFFFCCCCSLFVLFSFIYAEFYDFFPSSNFAFVVVIVLLLSLVILDINLGCLFDVSLLSWSRLVLL